MHLAQSAMREELMGFIVFFLIWYFAYARNNPKIFDKIRRHKVMIGIIIAGLVLSNTSSTLLGLSVILATIGLPIYFIFKAIKGIAGGEKQEAKEARRARDEAIPRSEQLPNAVPKRIKIVEKFNNKYNLNLTSSQIQTIVDASYISTDWEYLILSMQKEYQTIHQWFKAPIGGWLRVYLKVFNVQTVSSDMAQQKRICLDSFDQIFRSIDLSDYNTPAWDISHVNNIYMTNFDDISFMIAYRFLESNGHKYNLGEVEILKTDDELSKLRKKYDEDAQGMQGRMPGV